MTKVRWEEMFKDELEAAIARRPVCYLAYGHESTELDHQS